ncbi:hypothetical protein ACSIGC_16315 [Tenacibaculum sp. ZS6-P6]|uniref:hypothetical protein n=1 Tax=Tenacibaculum sp. ZS6-P6 TaxID=3447503 RepID=UPI003F992BCB
MKTKIIILLTITLSFSNCKKDKTVKGFWIVKSVMVGDEIMTPNSRWMKFNSDFTQQSGNGWFQHSIGTWNFNQNSQELSIKNTNGLTDQNEPFKVSFDTNKMIWKRIEEGQNVKVTLEKTNQLPKTYGDKLLGLWKLEKSNGNGIFFDESVQNNEYLFLRWDKRFLINSSNGRIRGIYNVHGHKPEIQFIPYNDKIKRSFWKVEYNDKQISLRLLNSDSLVVKIFTRIHEFPGN